MALRIMINTIGGIHMKINIGDRVQDITTGKILYVIEYIDSGTKEFGPRYLCKGLKHTWSLTESELQIRPSKIKGLQK